MKEGGHSECDVSPNWIGMEVKRARLASPIRTPRNHINYARYLKKKGARSGPLVYSRTRQSKKALFD